MSKETDEIIEHVYANYPGTRCCIVVHYAVDHAHGWTARAHPFMEYGMPDILRRLADELERQQQEKSRRTLKQPERKRLR